MSKRDLSSSPSLEAQTTKRPKVEQAPAQPESSAARKEKPKKKRKRPPPPEPGTHDHVLASEIARVLAREANHVVQDDDGWEPPEGLAIGQQVEVVVKEISSTGDSIAILPSPYPPWAVVTPFALPDERILVQLHRHGRCHSIASLVRVIEPNESLRDGSLVRCQYFGKCAGCQYQMLSYETQLDLKRSVVVRAYAYFSGLSSSVVPDILPTIPSPLTYGYRTKITPHFDAPPGGGRRGKQKSVENGSTGLGVRGDWQLRIGFDQKGTRRVMDIEECPIATDVINTGLAEARRSVHENIHTYKRGATLLLRDSLLISPALPTTADRPRIGLPEVTTAEVAAVVDDCGAGTIDETARTRSPVDIVTDVQSAETLISTASPIAHSGALAGGSESTVDHDRGAEMEDTAPRFPPPETDAAAAAAPDTPSFDPSSAGTLTDAAVDDNKLPTPTQSSAQAKEEHVCVTSPSATIYERVGPHLFAFPASAFFQNNNAVLVPLTDYVRAAIQDATVGKNSEKPSHLVDAYCGSGLFSLTLGSMFETVTGIDISPPSITSALGNLKLNSLSTDKYTFQTGTASDIFDSVRHFPASRTAVVIDPPRKGCDEPFLKQLLAFKPKVVVYVSCNVHTQARDIGWLLTNAESEGKESYRIVSIRGFDLFPQTAHVESVAVLTRE